jgi:antitoxin YefM
LWRTIKNTKSGGKMRQINFENDIKPLSEFRANAANLVKQVKDSKRPLILTQHGKSSAVLVDVAAYQALIDQLELLQEVQLAEKQVAEGKYLSDEELKKRLANRYQK